MTSPAPSWPREDLPLPGRAARLPRLLPVPADQSAEPVPPLAVGPAAGAEPVSGIVVDPAAGTDAGARPQTTQYPSSIVPPHPGWVHATVVVTAAALPP
jgi:hypothetical protein